MADQKDELRWSSSFAVTAAPTAGFLRGDKINLPQSALEQLLSASPSIPIESTATSFTAFDPSNPYSVSAARQERSFYRDTSQQLPNPLMFRLVNPGNGNAVYAGIREFSAAEGEVALSPYLMDALGIPENQLVAAGWRREEPIDLTADVPGPRITVHANHLPKGTYVRLRPLEAGYNPDDWKSLLERELRDSYTTLTKDSVLSVRGVKNEEFRFSVDKLRPDGDGICVVDTDLEVDIEPLDEDQARETMRQIMSKTLPGSASGSSGGGELDVWKSAEGQVVPGDYVDFELPSWDRTSPIIIELRQYDGEDALDLFVSPKSRLQRSLPRNIEHVFGHFSGADSTSKSITIQPSNFAMEGAEKLLIAVHSNQSFAESFADDTSIRFSLRARVGEAQIPGLGPDSRDRPPEDAQCKNCLQWVPRHTMMLHENFCLRNNVICPLCKAVFKKSSAEWQSHWHCDFDDAHGNSSTR
jgi:hypothetical protein